jgi:hypothetical protein
MAIEMMNGFQALPGSETNKDEDGEKSQKPPNEELLPACPPEPWRRMPFAVCLCRSVNVNPQPKPVKPRRRMLNLVNMAQIICKCFIMNNLQNKPLPSSQTQSK